MAGSASAPYASELRDPEWAILAQLLPPATSGRAAHGRSAGDALCTAFSGMWLCLRCLWVLCSSSRPLYQKQEEMFIRLTGP